MKSFRVILLACFTISVIFIIICNCCISDEPLQQNRIAQQAKKSLINYMFLNDFNDFKTKSVVNILLNRPNDLIYKYVHLPLDMKYGSNSIPLTVATLLTSGDILELGMGMFSTPLLHNIATDQKRQMVSIETNYDWLQKFIIYNKTINHKIYRLNSFKLNYYGLDKHWGLVLVDHIYNTKRSSNVINFSKRAQIVVVHDAEKSQEDFYHYEKNKLQGYFKYACKFSIYSESTQSEYISTLILSNFVNLDKLSDIFNKVITSYGHVACDLNL